MLIYDIFQNNKILDILGYALKENSVNYRILKPTNFKSTLREFNVSKYAYITKWLKVNVNIVDFNILQQLICVQKYSVIKILCYKNRNYNLF